MIYNIRYKKSQCSQDFEQFVNLYNLKKGIDAKIKNILIFLEDNQEGNAKETAISQILQQKNKNQWVGINETMDKSDIFNMTSTSFEPTQSRIEFNTNQSQSQFNNILPQFLQEYEPQKYTIKISEPQPNQQHKQQQINGDNQSCSSENQFINIKVSDDGTDPDMWIYKIEEQQQNFQPVSIQPIRIKYCQSKSQGDADMSFGDSIIQVPQQYEEDNPFSSLQEIQTLPPLTALKEKNQNLNQQDDRIYEYYSQQTKQYQDQQRKQSQVSQQLNTHRSFFSVRNKFLKQLKPYKRFVVTQSHVEEMQNKIKQYSTITNKQYEINKKIRINLIKKVTKLKKKNIYKRY